MGIHQTPQRDHQAKHQEKHFRSQICGHLNLEIKEGTISSDSKTKYRNNTTSGQAAEATQANPQCRSADRSLLSRMREQRNESSKL
jgi:hypothetical protein